MRKHRNIMHLQWLLCCFQIAELNSHAAELIAEIDELKTTIAKQKQDYKKLSTDMSEAEQRTQGFEK